MGEPEHASVHNYAYNPSVASWVQSTSLAQLDHHPDEPSEDSPDDFYKSNFAPQTHSGSTPFDEDMTTATATTRQRQQSSNGAVRSSTKPSSTIRSVSGPASSLPPSRSNPQIPVNRPTVRSLAQKFNHPSSVETTPPQPSRTRQVRPSPSSKSTAGASSPAASPSSNHGTKEAAYGAYRFNNLKPRERPQPAPASPASVRRTHGIRTSSDQQASPSPARRNVASPTRSQTQPVASTRQPFFGEVVGNYDESTPGFGIPMAESHSHGSESQETAPSETSTIKLVCDDSQLSPAPLVLRKPAPRYYAKPLEMSPVQDLRSHERRQSPPSRIPVARRRMSITSDSSSSTRSHKAGSSLPRSVNKRPSPTSFNRPVAAKQVTPNKKSGAPSHITLPATSYRDYRERGKSPKGSAEGTSLAVVVTPSPQPVSPRLRHSNERQLIAQESPSKPKSIDTPTKKELDVPQQEPVKPLGSPMIRMVEPDEGLDLGDFAEFADVTAPQFDQSRRSSNVLGLHIEHQPANVAPQSDSLAIRTSTLNVPPMAEPLSSTTDFEQTESPILGMPGSFLATPPMLQQYSPLIPPETSPAMVPQMSPTFAQQLSPAKPQSMPGSPTKASMETSPQSAGELLQARAFVPPSKEPVIGHAHEADPPSATSILSVGESIPIMLGSEARPDWSTTHNRPRHSPRLSIGAHKWRADPLDSSGTIAYLDEDDSPIDSLSNRKTLGPDDSASNIAFYRRNDNDPPNWTPPVPPIPDVNGLTLDSKAYSVINEVLNMYHQSDQITAEVASTAKHKIQQASPIVAQHKDWGSKEATETYLARLLSDAATAGSYAGDQAIASPKRTSEYPPHPAHAANLAPKPLGFDEEPEQGISGGTAIIFQTESRRYSRGSHGSATTTIYEGSRADSSSGNLARDSLLDSSGNHLHVDETSKPPKPPPKDWRYSPSPEVGHSPAASSSTERLGRQFGTLLPELEHVGEGLGLSLKAGRQQALRSIGYPPPRPPYSPPPPPGQITMGQQSSHSNSAAPYTPSIYGNQPPSSVVPQAPLPGDPPRMSMFAGPPFGRPDEGPDGESLPPRSTEDASGSKGKERATTDDLAVNTESGEVASSGSGPSGDSDDASMQRLKRRYRVMEEIAMTEHTFLCDMMVAHRMWAASYTVISTDEREKRTLFCNVEELSKVSYLIWDDIREAIGWVFNQEIPPPDGEERDPPYDEFLNLNENRDRRTTVGAVFLKYMPQLERVFNTYLLNHEDASALIKQKSKEPPYLGWQMACYNESKGLTNAWDLDSLLVKPVQRVLKYPLLLEELEKVTPEDHPDFANISSARKEMIAVSTRINQNKHRKETLRAAAQEGKKEKNKGFRGMGFVKALTNKTTDKVKQPSTAEGYVDNEYEKHAQKFGGHFFQLQIVLKDLDKYHEEMTMSFLQLNIVALGFIQVLESAPPTHTELASAWRQKTMAMLELRNVLLEDHKKAVRQRIVKPMLELWNLQVRPQKLMEQRKKLLPTYIKYKALIDRGEKADSKLEDIAESFVAVNDALKYELPKMYELTQKCVRSCLGSLIMFQKDWWKNCQKKLLPLLDYEPEHTTSFTHDMQCYVDRYGSDVSSVQNAVNHLAICNGSLVNDMANFMSPLPTWAGEDSSSRKSSSRRTESISSDLSTAEPRSRRSGGFTHRSTTQSFEGPPRSAPHDRVHQATIAGPSAPRASRDRGDRPLRSERVPTDKTEAATPDRNGAGRNFFPSLDGTADVDRHHSAPALASAYLSPQASAPNSARASGVFNSALPMPDSDREASSADDVPGTPADGDEPEVLFLAASLFEFNIAHDRREGGIPYLVYVPGEIFDVIGMKGELWLARNQDDPSKTVGWIWEKHFARILPEEI
ncbi:hypothetical protein BU24DRAFT_464415 [Aaosphaeria arxii CBS 175.79]|uniref:DH domain-containing protein n=1 Tax=Aaosphaeria arxii CBS 175.79 TaxID=1450172 RepID=A0A6A5XL89_9PLEO|nr:uncharacterized protein BU24DRAFT_464415 [Aaosphaeria arxii CBS 175.79]KAF2013656.1 hypothetical protein BU24DRAFT_464415 [Aaosphaeria arxii CBS 175.79]